eukprot:scaffold64703_cov32-Tisochrysis_lutea.AAC.2
MWFMIYDLRLGLVIVGPLRAREGGTCELGLRGVSRTAGGGSEKGSGRGRRRNACCCCCCSGPRACLKRKRDGHPSPTLPQKPIRATSTSGLVGGLVQGRRTASGSGTVALLGLPYNMCTTHRRVLSMHSLDAILETLEASKIDCIDNESAKQRWAHSTYKPSRAHLPIESANGLEYRQRLVGVVRSLCLRPHGRQTNGCICTLLTRKADKSLARVRNSLTSRCWTGCVELWRALQLPIPRRVSALPPLACCRALMTSSG